MEPLIRLYGLKATEFMLREPARRADSLKPVMNVIGEEMLLSQKELFRTEGASGGAPWKALEPSTVERKKGNAKILDRTGHEEMSFTEQGAPDNLFNATRSFVLIGSKAPGVPFQIDGTKNMEDRDPMQFRPDQVERWAQHVSDFIFNGALPNA